MGNNFFKKSSFPGMPKIGNFKSNIDRGSQLLKDAVSNPADLIYGQFGLTKSALEAPGKRKAAKKAARKAMETDRRLLLRGLDSLGLDPQSTQEARTLLESGVGGLGQAQSIVEGARLGTELKYKARRESFELYNLLVDQPGSRQTRDQGPSLLMGNAFMGRGR